MGDVVRTVDWSAKPSLETTDSADKLNLQGLGDLTLGDVLKLLVERQEKLGGSGGGDDMNTRITNLERDMTEVKVSLGKIETRLGQIESTMLTKGYAALMALGVGVAVFAGGWWVVQQYLAPLVAHIPK